MSARLQAAVFITLVAVYAAGGLAALVYISLLCDQKSLFEVLLVEKSPVKYNLQPAYQV